MTAPDPPEVVGAGRHLVLGGTRVFLAESLVIPTGLITAAYLGRRLGPDGYGLFVLAAALVGWVEWSLSALFGRAAVRFVAEAPDWRPIGATVVTVQLVLAVAAGLLLAGLAMPIAVVLGAPALAGLLQLFAADVPLFCLAQAHRQILVGRGAFAERSRAAAARWVSRLLLIILLVEAGWSIQGAVLGSIGASLVELAVCRAYVRPSYSLRALRGIGVLLGFAGPLLVSAVALRLFDRLDLVLLVALDGTPELAGFYGAALSLAILPGLVALSFSPLLLSTLTRAHREGSSATARRIGGEALRWTLLLAPIAGMAAGSAEEIIGLVFGPAFLSAAPLLGPLLFAALALAMVAMATAILIAAGRPGLTLALTGPLPLLAGIGYLVFIPMAGAPGAAWVTLAAAMSAALGTVLAAHRVCQVRLPMAAALRSGVACAAAYAAAATWPAQGLMLVLELTAIGGAIVLAYWIWGELAPAEITRRPPRESDATP